MSNPSLRAKLRAFVAAPDAQAIRDVVDRSAEVLFTDKAEVEFELWIQEEHAKHKSVTLLRSRADLLKQLRALEYIRASEAIFLDFMSVPNRDELRQFAQQLSDKALDALEQLAEQKSNSARTSGNHTIARAIRERLNDLKILHQSEAEVNPLVMQLEAFVTAHTEEDARLLLLAQPDLMLSLDAELALARFRASDDHSKQQLEMRRALWRQVRYGRSLSITQPSAASSLSTRRTTQSELFPLSGEYGSTAADFVVLNPTNCAIGPSAMVINHSTHIPLQWKQPHEVRADVSGNAVGRETDLNRLHERLKQGSAQTVLGIRGMPGIGKTVVAALYSMHYGAAYPGGVIWIQLSPSMRTTESINPELNRIASYAYGADAQVQETLHSTQFSPEVVQMLLDGHGRMLWIVDDVWDAAVLEPIKRAAPHDATIVVTTRDLDVAFSTAGTEQGVITLNALTQEDARLLMQNKVPALSDVLANNLADGLERHPQALTIAASTLARRGHSRYKAAVDEIIRRVHNGEGFGDLPRMDKEDRINPVEVALRYSYDYLGEHAKGTRFQRCFRALGALAAGAAFDSTGVNAVLEEEAETEEILLMFNGLSLLSEVQPPQAQMSARWEQHMILRAYALGMQTADERLTFSHRHARHYLARLQQADRSQYYHEIIPELPNLKHAFRWAVHESLELAHDLVAYGANLLRGQNLGHEYLEWAEQVLARAKSVGGLQAQGRAWDSYGSALQAVSTLLLGEDRSIRLRQALAAYNEALKLMMDMSQDYATALHNKANLLSELGNLPGEDRAARLRGALATYDSALELRRGVPLAYASTQSNKAVVLMKIAGLPGEDRASRLREALVAIDAALEVQKPVPLAYANAQSIRADLLRGLASLPGEDRAALLREALAAIDTGLDVQRDLPLAYAGAQNSRASLLRELASLPSEDRVARLREALAAVEVALEHRKAVPLDFAHSQGIKATLLTDLASVPDEDRPSRLREAHATLSDAMKILKDVPLDYATALNNLGNVLRELATLPGEDRAARLKEALTAYDAALDLRKYAPLEYASTQNNKAVVLMELASIAGEDRTLRLQQALSETEGALKLQTEAPLEYAQTQNSKAVVLIEIATLPDEDRASRLYEAMVALDTALELQDEVPLSYATTQNNRVGLLLLLAALPGEDRAARLKEALAALNATIGLRKNVPLEHARTYNNKAALLLELATLTGEDRVARTQEALEALDVALELQQDSSLEYGQTQSTRAIVLSKLAAFSSEDRAACLQKALVAVDSALKLQQGMLLPSANAQGIKACILTEIATLPGEDRAARLWEALAAFDSTLELQRDVPLDYAQTQTNKANLLRELATLAGENHAARLHEAMLAYDAALARLREVPLDYAATLFNKAALLMELAILPGEDRIDHLGKALQNILLALRIFESRQESYSLEVSYHLFSSLLSAFGLDDLSVIQKRIVSDEPILPLLPEELVTVLHDQPCIFSDLEFENRLEALIFSNKYPDKSME
ncbi:MAG TPA: NB-ARC domain-containing protein [Aggregatilinea sp.]|uniref:NB-ARC domain-containing protein n=1 Tax=Aggregatilinea sp. TaxID=2806333 RepID=UPI002C0C1E08|nr:NB-ARC domain-containing protein [Aggregatilinea sp.]HML22178.1 NB-ARC domain-containing protein [Aggregatilinea sp.]